jgi:hypothetical protein
MGRDIDHRVYAGTSGHPQATLEGNNYAIMQGKNAIRKIASLSAWLEETVAAGIAKREKHLKAVSGVSSVGSLLLYDFDENIESFEQLSELISHFKIIVFVFESAEYLICYNHFDGLGRFISVMTENADTINVASCADLAALRFGLYTLIEMLQRATFTRII